MRLPYVGTPHSPVVVEGYLNSQVDGDSLLVDTYILDTTTRSATRCEYEMRTMQEWVGRGEEGKDTLESDSHLKRTGKGVRAGSFLQLVFGTKKPTLLHLSGACERGSLLIHWPHNKIGM